MKFFDLSSSLSYIVSKVLEEAGCFSRGFKDQRLSACSHGNKLTVLSSGMNLSVLNKIRKILESWLNRSKNWFLACSSKSWTIFWLLYSVDLTVGSEPGEVL